MFFIKVFSALYPLNGSRNRRFVEKASSVAAESERARRFRDARAFSGIAATAARKRTERRGRNGDERTRAAQEAKHTETTETGTNREGKRRAELARGSGEEEEERREGSKARKTLQAAEKSIGEPSAQEPRARTGVETRERRARERRASARSGLYPDKRPFARRRRVAHFLRRSRSSLHLRTDPLIRCHRTLRSVRSLRPRLGAGQLVCRCTAAAATPVIIAIRGAATLALFNENNTPPGVRILMRVASVWLARKDRGGAARLAAGVTARMIIGRGNCRARQAMTCDMAFSCS